MPRPSCGAWSTGSRLIKPGTPEARQRCGGPRRWYRRSFPPPAGSPALALTLRKAPLYSRRACEPSVRHAMSLNRIHPSQRSGSERLHADGQPLEGCHDLLEYWQWMGSDLIGNIQRGILAEFIVGVAVGDTSVVNDTRDAWENYDLTSSGGVKIEVKSAAYIQSWKQAKESSPAFDISKALSWDPDTEQNSKEPTRSADVYVFCLHSHRADDPIDDLDSLNVSQWEFYVLPTTTLDHHFPEQKTVGMDSLKRIGARKIPYENLGCAVNDARGT